MSPSMREESRPRASATPIPVPNVLGVSISWPNGKYSIVVSAGALVPHPVALVRVAGPGRIIVQWRVDGNPYHTAVGRAKKAGDIRFGLDLPLPSHGAHQISLAVLSPPLPALASPTPAPSITYQAGGQ